MEHIERLRLAKKALADRLMSIGYSQSMTSELTSGKRKPSLQTAAHIESEIGIPAAAWASAVPLEEMWAIVVKEAQ